jgi:hypothetical protein
MLTTENYGGPAPYATKTDGTTTILSGPYGAYSTANNNGGTIRANGTVSSGVVTSVTTVRPVVDAFGSKVVEDTVTIKDYAGKAVSGGEFAHNHVKPISSLITTELAGVATDVIKTPGNDGDTIRSIHKLETLRTRRFTAAVRGNKYNRVTDTWDNGYPVVAVDTLATDAAATPTAAVPGELVYMAGGKVPVYGTDANSSYKPKTSA